MSVVIDLEQVPTPVYAQELDATPVYAAPTDCIRCLQHLKHVKTNKPFIMENLPPYSVLGHINHFETKQAIMQKIKEKQKILIQHKIDFDRKIKSVSTNKELMLFYTNNAVTSRAGDSKPPPLLRQYHPGMELEEAKSNINLEYDKNISSSCFSLDEIMFMIDNKMLMKSPSAEYAVPYLYGDRIFYLHHDLEAELYYLSDGCPLKPSYNLIRGQLHECEGFCEEDLVTLV